VSNALSRQPRRAAPPPKRRPRAIRLQMRRRDICTIALLTLCLIGFLWLHVWLRLQVVQMGYVLATTAKLQSRLEQEQRELKLEMATLTSPERLQAMARKRLGLVPPEKDQVIVLP
jgi:cell division protein FtsL